MGQRKRRHPARNRARAAHCRHRGGGWHRRAVRRHLPQALMVARLVSFVILLTVVSALVFCGVAFGAYAFFAWLSTYLPEPGAAALTAVLLLLFPLALWLTIKLRRPPRHDDVLMGIFAGLAK